MNARRRLTGFGAPKPSHRKIFRRCHYVGRRSQYTCRKKRDTAESLDAKMYFKSIFSDFFWSLKVLFFTRDVFTQFFTTFEFLPKK